jgi:small subunit ribosomal protein S27Ae
VYVTGDLDGGKKKKKKKAYTTKKKNKHIHKKVKLLPLSLYAVDGKFILI